MTPSLLDQYRYTISDIKLLDPPVSRWKISKPIFLIKIVKVPDGDNDLVKSVQGKFDNNQIVWNEHILYDVTAGFTIKFKILMKKGGTNEVEILIGEYTNSVSGLLYMQISKGICKAPLGQGSQLSFTIKKDSFKDMLDIAKQQSEGIYFTPEVSWSTFLAYFGTVKTAADSVASLNPYAQQVWSIVSIVPNIFQMHATRNSNVQKLFERLVDIYKYINETKQLSALTDTQSEKLKRLINTTCECVDFIKKYTKNSAATKFIKGPSFDNRISKFKESFDEIFETINDSLIQKIVIATSNIEDSNHLDGIQYADNVGLDSEKICLPGTREKLIREIEGWIHKEDTSERVLLLSGQAGTGKSAIAHTIAKTMNDRLGSFFCFNRSNKGRINFLFSTISRNLADRDVSWKRNLVQAIEDITIRKSFDPTTQFNEMIIKPSIGTTKRMVIIIDALDESGDQKERKILLKLLFERSSELPSNYRFIITSRPDHDIAQFHPHSNVCCKHMADVHPGDTLNDIQQFISDELSPVAEILDVVDKNWSLLLAQKAQSLFQWAKIACGHILEFEGFEAAQRLRTVLSKSTSSLYEMYHQILDSQPGCQYDNYLALLKVCVGAVIVSRKPLSVSALQAFFGPNSGDDNNVKIVMKSLNSLFIGTTESTAELRPIHTSLFDFFLHPEQKPGTPNRYYIDTSEQTSFTYECLRVMSEMLQFNICGLETSHLRNRDIPNFNSRVAEAIPLHLSYACCFWGYHLEYSPLTPDVLEKINDLMHNKLLYFFEVLSLLGEVDHHGRSAMQILISKAKDNNRELADRAAEASQFVVEFGSMMTESTPHLYLSSLPYISKCSLISQQFLPQYPQLLSMDVGQPIDLQPKIRDGVSQRHPSAEPSAVAFFPQGRQVACGWSNGDLWVWDYVTGESVVKVGPKEKPSAVCSVVFSLNGELVYCGFRDGSMLTWEAKTNKALYESNEELGAGKRCEHCITSPNGDMINFKHCTISPDGCHINFEHCTISPDGRYIAFEHDTLSFYERETRIKLFEDITGYDSRMMFSPSGSLFGFQSWDGNDHGVLILKLWDAQKQTFVPPFGLTATGWPFLVALNDNYVIVRARNQNTRDINIYEVWDIGTSAMIRRFESPWSGTFSTNGEYLLGSGQDKRWMCNISTGEVTNRFGNWEREIEVLSALSPDSKYIAFRIKTPTSCTMHVVAWDALPREPEERDLGPIRYDYTHRGGAWIRAAWLKGQHLLWKKLDSGLSWGYLQVFDTTRMGLKPDFQVNFIGFSRLEVSPEDNHWSIAYVGMDNSLRLWTIDEKKEFILDRPDGKPTALAFSATGDRLISGDSKGNIKIWHVRNRQLISHGGSSGETTALAFSQTGTTFWVAYETYEDTSVIEERECSESQNIINGPFTHDSPMDFISVSSNDAYIFMYSRMWASIRNLHRLNRSTGATLGYPGDHLSLKFSPNQRYIAWISKGCDGQPDTAKLCWNLEKNDMALDDGFPLAFDGVVGEFVFSNDSKRIGILSDETWDKEPHVDIWDIETKGLVMRHFYSDIRFERMALNDSLLWIGSEETAIMWDFRVHEIMTRLYDDNMDNTQSGILPGHPQTRRLSEDYKLDSENTEVLDYALVAWNKARFLPSAKLVDGWMLGPRDELLFWVPQEMRSGLWYPSRSFTKHKKLTKLNFDKFVYGTRWTECGK